MPEKGNDLAKALELSKGEGCDLNPVLSDFRVHTLPSISSTASGGHPDLIWLRELKFPVFSQESEVVIRRLHDLCPEGSSHRRRWL